MPQAPIPVEGFKSPGVPVVVEKLIKIYRIGRQVEVQALRGLDMRVEAGEAVTIMGPSGSGKTTLLNIIGGVDRPTGGKVLVGSIRVSELDEARLEKYRLTTVGYMFQAFNLVPVLTALENIELPMIALGLPRHMRITRAKWLLEQVGLAEYAVHRPTELSGGQQQRVAIGVALANDPPLVLADEPTAELDSENAMRIIRLLVELSKRYGKTLIVSTHDPRIAIRTDRIFRIEDGVIKGVYRPIEISEAKEATTPTGVIEVIKAKLAEVEKDIEDLLAAAAARKMSYEEFDARYQRLRELRRALRDLLASFGQ